MITPAGFLIKAGDYLHDANSGTGGGIPLSTVHIPPGVTNPQYTGTLLKIGTQQSGTTGGIGIYNLVPETGVTVPTNIASETMWSLPGWLAGTSPGGQRREILEHTQCAANGKTYLVKFSGMEIARFAHNITLYVIPTFQTENNGSVKSGSWNNGQITLWSPPTYVPPVLVTGGIVQ